MDKAKKLLQELEQEIPQNERDVEDINTVQDMLGMIAELVDEFTSGRSSNQSNPYSRKVVMKALKMLAEETGITDPYDVDLKKLIGLKQRN